ncbi:glycosyl hydrolase family 95 catalytic domain-containing protein [Streptomyces shenzhenensis]|uniref:glycosyl hydrolase family 95 catalytic domain-containing protein n=1 Tax=Streptomyces shenzhenensis TaxID=943815 RepID=UPI003D8F25E9
MRVSEMRERRRGPLCSAGVVRRLRGAVGTSLASVLVAVAAGVSAPAASSAAAGMMSPSAATADGTTAWSDGSFHVDAHGVVSRSDVIYERAPAQPYQSAPLGNGTMGASVWAASGFTAQLNRGDTFPGLKSPGQVVIPGLAEMTGARDYAGRLSLYDGQFVQSGAGMTAVSYVSAGSDQLVVEITGAAPDVTQTVDVKLWTGRNPTAYASGTVAALGETFDDAASGQRFGSLAAATAAGRAVSATVVDDHTVRLSFKPRSDGSFRVVVAAPKYAGGSVGTAAAAAVAGTTPGSAATFEAGHLQWWHDLWDRVSPMKISSADGSGEYLENQRLLGLYTTAASMRGPQATSHGAVANLFSSFEDSADWSPQHYWHFNLRMQTSQNFAANMADFNAPYFGLYENNFATRKAQTAQLMPGSSGVCIPEVMRFDGSGDDHGLNQCLSSGNDTPVARILSSGPEIAYNMWRQYLFTRDESFLNASYPFMADVVRFYLWRAPVGIDGKRHIVDANALETQWHATDPAPDVAAMKVLFPLVRDLAAARGDTTLADQLAAAIPQLPELAKTTRNGKTVLGWSATSGIAHNKQNPDLEPVWPWNLYGDQPGPDHTLASDTFINRVYPQAYDWGMDATWAARLGRNEDVKNLLVQGTKDYQTFPNGFSRYEGAAPEGRTSFYNEWQWVVSTSLQEALVQNYDGLLRVPAAWPSGWDVDGALRIEGGHRVSVQVRAGTPTLVGIEAARDDTLRMRNPWKDQQIQVRDGATGAVLGAPTTAPAITIHLTKGSSVVVERTAAPLSSFTYSPVSGTAATTAKHLGTRAIGLDRADLTYGSNILLQNQSGGNGGYLDANGLSAQQGASYDVSTNPTPNSRGPATSVWKVVSATGKANGTPVESGDLIYLINQYGNGTYLNVNGYAIQPGAKYDVSTTATKDRGPGTGTWHIFGKTSSPTDGHIRNKDIVHLLNDYGTANGGYLDTNGPSTQQGATYDTSTSPYTDRAPGTGSWKVLTS